jgi:hypothetical protein
MECEFGNDEPRLNDRSGFMRRNLELKKYPNSRLLKNGSWKLSPRVNMVSTSELRVVPLVVVFQFVNVSKLKIASMR